jgi:glucosylceramidase
MTIHPRLQRLGVGLLALLATMTATLATASAAHANSDPSGATSTSHLATVITSAAPAAAKARVTRPSTLTPATASYFRIINRSSGKCLTPWGSGDGTAVTQVTCDGSSNQWWLLDTGSVGQISNYGTGKCLDLWGNGSSDAQLVFTWTCYGAASQRWRPVNVGGSYFELHPYYTDKCLDLANSSSSDGAVIQQWGCHWLNPNQQWWLG